MLCTMLSFNFPGIFSIYRHLNRWIRALACWTKCSEDEMIVLPLVMGSTSRLGVDTLALYSFDFIFKGFQWRLVELVSRFLEWPGVHFGRRRRWDEMLYY